MRSCLLVAAMTMVTTLAQAEETGASLASESPLSGATRQSSDLAQRLQDSERQREELQKQLLNGDAERESAQLARLRQENQRLKLQLKEALAAEPRRILTEQQQWFATGGGVALIALLCGFFARGGRKQRRQWLN